MLDFLMVLVRLELLVAPICSWSAISQREYSAFRRAANETLARGEQELGPAVAQQIVVPGEPSRRITGQVLDHGPALAEELFRLPKSFVEYWKS